MSKQLPPNASLEHLKNQAKQLFKAYRQGDAAARGRVEAHPRRPDACVTLQTAQLALAREYGYANWQLLGETVANPTPVAAGDRVCWTDPKTHRLDSICPPLHRFLTPGLRVVDIGCGYGSIALDVGRKVAPGSALGIDRRPDRIEYARRAAAGSVLDNVDFQIADARSLPADAGPFDLAYCTHVLEGSDDPVAVLAAMKRVVKPGGWVVAGMTDYGAAAFYPPCPAAERVYKGWSNQGQAFRSGREILKLFRRAGLATPAMDIYGIPQFTADASDPERLRGRYVQIRHHMRAEHPRLQALIETGQVEPEVADQAQEELLRWKDNPDAFQTWCMGVLGYAQV